MGLSHPDDDNTQVEDIDEHILYAISYAHLNHIYFVSSKIKRRLNNIKRKKRNKILTNCQKEGK